MPFDEDKASARLGNLATYVPRGSDGMVKADTVGAIVRIEGTAAS